MTKRLFLPLAVAAVGLVTFGLPLAVNAADETCSCSARKEWVAIRAAEMRAEREAAAKAEAEAVAEKAAAEEQTSATEPQAASKSGG